MITTNYSVQSTPNFQARLNFNDIKLGNQVKAKAVEKLFETKTGHYKDGQLDLVKTALDRDDGTIFHGVDIISEDGDLGFIVTIKEFKKWFNGTSVKNIADQLAHLYKYGKLRVKNLQTEDSILKNIRSTTFSMNKNLRNAAIMAEEGNQAASSRFATMANINSKRLATLNDTLDKTTIENTALEFKVSSNLPDVIELDPMFGRIKQI